MKKKILLFGGTFDPIHNGHIKMVEKVKRQLNIDQVIFILAKNPRWKDNTAPYQDRLAMLKLAIDGLEDYFLSLYEIEREVEINYSIDTILYYKSIYQDAELYYLLGFDQVEQFNLWKDAEEISKKVHLVAYGRSNYQNINYNLEKYHFQIVEGPSFNISSTNVRKLESLDIPLPVFNYILDNNLYFSLRLKDFFSKDRYLHTLSVANLTYDIALRNGLNTSKALIASLLHDIAKEMDIETQNRILNTYFPHHEQFPPFAIHQYVGAIIANQEFYITDEEVLDAIRYHASGKPNMSPLGKILYAADKIEPRRMYDSKSYIELCKNDYELGFLTVLKANYNFHKEKNRTIKYDLVEECYNYYFPKKEGNADEENS